jgi:hypothetical protein
MSEHPESCRDDREILSAEYRCNDGIKRRAAGPRTVSTWPLIGEPGRPILSKANLFPSLPFGSDLHSISSEWAAISRILSF